MAESCSGMNLEFIKPQNLGSLFMKSSQSNLIYDRQVRSYLITTVTLFPIKGSPLMGGGEIKNTRQFCPPVDLKMLHRA